MASRVTRINGYKLDSLFPDDSSVIHTNSLISGKRVTVPPTTWKREDKLGVGAFGTVWRERERKTGQLRAVKVVSKRELNVWELEVLIDLQDVSLFFYFL